MSVYIDNARIPYGRMLMCHMFADTHEELVAMAKKIGLSIKHIQHEGQPNEHFDVSSAYRAKAIKEGAVEVDQRSLVKLIKRKRNQISRAQNEAFAKALSELEPEPAPDFKEPEDGPEASGEEPPRRGGLNIRKRPEPEEPEEDGENEADQRE